MTPVQRRLLRACAEMCMELAEELDDRHQVPPKIIYLIGYIRKSLEQEEQDAK
jgi:hypothetical protein